MRLLVATGNMGKLNEYRDMLHELDVEWVSLRDLGLEEMEVQETGTTFAENAILKATSYGKAADTLTLADDSGLEVDALEGAPGVYSARYGAPEVTTDEGRYQKLLQDLQGVPPAARSARFVCVVAIFVPGQAKPHTVRGTVEGQIGYEPRGNFGFGYDPIFVIEDGRHLAELPPQQKHAISHRGNALQRALPYLLDTIKKMDV